MAAYMRHVQPFHGVPTPTRAQIVKRARSAAPLESREAYEQVVRELWGGERREEKYAALDVAGTRGFLTLEALPLLEDVLRDTDWWDVLDPLAISLLGRALRGSGRVRERAEAWSASEHLWTRRAAILVQLSYKTATDTALLEDVLAAHLSEQDFFIRKAIGWALREYAKTNPAWALDFVARHDHEISALSRREGLKHLR